ncbi:hypothetical protein [Mycolicibacterium smegmatis]|uniref:hypothetical protein n=1 Tax=Mycolicibacterium smegmatis TaxID=1772 RepID=UPI00130361B2|nr:hypothetical protein [Mycolicibacterium smegmatis]
MATTRRMAGVLGAALLTAALGLTPGTANAAEEFTYQPLWPFASQADAGTWLREGGPAGHAPWHADPSATALSFTRDYLGFTEIDRVTDVTEHADEAWVDVGYVLPNDRPTTAATIHLARYGAAPDAPWEVVGSRDDVLTLTAPPYGSPVSQAIDAGGAITGVDESLRLRVHQNGPEQMLGEHCCVAAGGEAAPWSATVNFIPPQPGTVTLVVWTGGHVAEVEKFAVTGLLAS